MNPNKLSMRLETVANYVPKGAKTADIGSDHAYLPCYLVKNREVPFAIAGEVADGPYQSAVKNVLAEGLSKSIEVRLGDGLEVINQGEVDCITIAGMGGALIVNILENGKDKLTTVQRLVLQPNISAFSIRKWLYENGWELKAEEILEEDGKIYEVLLAEQGNAKKPYSTDKEMELLFGPFLLEKKDPVFKKKWIHEKKNWERIYHQLKHAAQSPETIEKEQELLHKMKMLEEVFKDEGTERF